MYAYGDCDNGLGPVVGWCVVVPLSILDLPISLLTDTLWLPADIVRNNREKKDAANQAPEDTARKLVEPHR